MDFAVLADHRVKLKESRKGDKYLALARGLKIMEYEGDGDIIVAGALRTIFKGLVKGLEDLEIRGQVDTIKTVALLRLTRILRKVLET